MTVALPTNVLPDAQRSASAQSLRVQRVLTFGALLGGAGAAAVSIAVGGLEHVALPWLSFGVLCIPMLSRRFELVSLWTFVLLAGFIGLVVRPLAITIGWPSPVVLELLFVRGRTADFFFSYHALFLGMTVLLVTSYSAGRARASQNRAPTRPRELRESRVNALTAFSLGAGLASFLLYAQLTGGLDLSSFSNKRTVIGGLELDNSFRGFQVIATINRIGFMGYFILLDHRLSKSGKLSLAQLPFLGLLLANGVLLGIYRSERLPVLVALILTFLALSSYAGRIRIGSLGRGALVVLLAFQLLTSARSGGAALETENFVSQTFESLVENRNMLDPSKTAHIIDAVPEIVEFEKGGTIINYVLAPVPRALWPSKPIIAPGPTLGITVFGTRRSGVPPGLFAELYWNFGAAGILGGVAIAGFVFGRIDARLRRQLRVPGFHRVAALVVLTQVGANAMGIAIGHAMLTAAIDIGVLWFLFQVFGGRPKNLSQDSSLQASP